METFNFPYHRFRTEYPESGNRVQLGNSYLFTAPPSGPDMRKFILTFPAMRYYTLTDGLTIDLSASPTQNMAVLEAFYNNHKLHKSFLYPHPVYGNKEVKFYSPLKIPEGTRGGNGLIEDIQIELLEVQN